jgi:Nitrate reductase gamma subunit
VRAHGEGGPGDSRPNGTASRDVGATPESRARQTRRHGTLLWLLLPYLALAGVVLGHVWRWRHDAFGWRTFRTPLVQHRLLRLGSRLVHLGVVAVFVGHLVGLLVPTSWTAAVGITNATYHLDLRHRRRDRRRLDAGRPGAARRPPDPAEVDTADHHGHGPRRAGTCRGLAVHAAGARLGGAHRSAVATASTPPSPS